MKPEWKTFLENRGAEFIDGTVVSFGNPVRELRMVTTGDVITDLSHWGLVAVHGEDAQAFLQGQFTNDLREVSESHSQLNAFCSPKGRVLANFRIFRRNSSYYLRMPRAQVDPCLKRLRMFVLRAQVTLEDASDHLVRIGLSGPEVESRLREQFGKAPQQPDDALQVDDLTVVRLRGPQPRFEIYGELDAMKKLWTALDVHAAPVGCQPWALLDVYAGVPVIHPDTSDAFVPQMINLQIIDGVNFKKGCYTGQEVVARMQYLGKLKRRMYRAHIDMSECPPPGTQLFARESTSGQGAGRVVNAAPAPAGGCELLVVVEIASRESDAIHLSSIDGPPLQFESLPYEFPVETAKDQA